MSMHRLIEITCDSHISYALSEHHLPLGFTPGERSDCNGCRDALSRLNGAALAFSHISKQQRSILNAVHEAGHAVLHILFGHVVNYAMVADDPDASGVIGSVNFDAYTTAYRLAITTWAGREAVLLQLDQWDALDDASRVDAAYAVRGDWEFLTGLGLGQLELEPSRVCAGELVAEHWPAVERVADALLARGRLTGDDITDVAGLTCNV
jgi:hypothetical protein